MFRKTARFEELGLDVDALEGGGEADRAPFRDVDKERVELEDVDRWRLEPERLAQVGFMIP